MKTLNHTVSFPSAVGELVVQYNFTPAEPWLGTEFYKPEKPAEIEITNILYLIAGVRIGFNISPTVYMPVLESLKQAVYTEHMRLLKEKEDAEAERQDGFNHQQLQDHMAKMREEDFKKPTNKWDSHIKPGKALSIPVAESKGVHTQMPSSDHILQLLPGNDLENYEP